MTGYLHEEPGEEVLLELEPYLGLRAWRVSPAGELRSVHRPHWWPFRQPLEATCDSMPKGAVALFARVTQGRPAHDPPFPALDCQCGVYAVKPDLDLLNYVTLSNGPHVYGLVSLWGRVIEHEHGYRAQHARPLALWEANVVPDAEGHTDEEVAKMIAKVIIDHRVITAVAARYGVPLTDWGKLEAK